MVSDLLLAGLIAGLACLTLGAGFVAGLAIQVHRREPEVPDPRITRLAAIIDETGALRKQTHDRIDAWRTTLQRGLRGQATR